MIGDMQRIMIIGGAGSGKSTLARALGGKLDLPVYHMDREVHWLPGWVERPKADKTRLVESIVAKDRWVFEGGHSSTYALRLARADFLIWTDAPLLRRFLRITQRSLRQWGQTRPDLADGCPERLTSIPGFFRFLWVNRHRIESKLEAAFIGATIPKRKLASFAETEAFLAEFDEAQPKTLVEQR